MSSPLRWADLPGRRVGVWGVGVEGRATLRRLEQLGVTPHAVVDDRPPDPSVRATGEGGLEALAACDVVVKAPGISRYSPAVSDLESAGVTVAGGLGLWLEENGTADVVAVTGTKGKSTTTAVAAHLAAGLGVAAAVAGNIGSVPWDPAATAAGRPQLWIVEISSYQATDVWSTPAVTALTSLHPDHLDWHGSVERYYADKLSVATHPGGRVLVVNATDERLRARAPTLGPPLRWVDAGDDPAWTAALGLRGRHNVVNARIAAACLEEMGVDGAVEPEKLAAAAAGFVALPHRLETVAEVGGVEFVDDSLSTNVLPTLAAAEVFEGRPLALIAGGFDRDIDYTPLGRFMAGRSAPSLVLTLPQNGPRVAEAVRDAGGEVRACADIADAVRRGAAWTPPGGVVLLSPAAPSYGLFANYKERGAAFRAAVAALG